MDVKKILGIAGIALVAFFLLSQPDASAGLVRQILGALGDGAQAIITFAQQLVA